MKIRVKYEAEIDLKYNIHDLNLQEIEDNLKLSLDNVTDINLAPTCMMPKSSLKIERKGIEF